MKFDVVVQRRMNGRKSRSENGILIGSVLERGGEIIKRGHNRQVQKGHPTAYVEIECLRNAGRIGNYRNTTLHPTLQPCQLCTGAILLFGIPGVAVGECEAFPGESDHLISQGIEVINLNLEECKEMMREFIAENSQLGEEDIGKQSNVVLAISPRVQWLAIVSKTPPSPRSKAPWAYRK